MHFQKDILNGKWIAFTCNNQISHSNTVNGGFLGSFPFCLPVSFMQQSIMSTYFNCLVLSLHQMGKFMYPSQSQQDIYHTITYVHDTQNFCTCNFNTSNRPFSPYILNCAYEGGKLVIRNKDLRKKDSI